MISFKGTFTSSICDRPVRATTRPKKHIIYVRMKPNGPQQAIVQIGQHYYIAALGRTGIKSRKYEGDGATPRAEMRCLMGFWRGERGKKPVISLPILKSKDHFGWSDGAEDPNYNRPVPRPHKASHETLQREDRLYNYVIVLDWNITTKTGGRRRGRGSAIFLHVAKEGYQPTEGCIALYPKDLAKILPRLTRQTFFKVI